MEVQFRRMRCLIHFSFAADETLFKLFTELCYGNISSEKRSTILLGIVFLLINVPTPLELILELLNH